MYVSHHPSEMIDVVATAGQMHRREEAGCGEQGSSVSGDEAWLLDKANCTVSSNEP